MSHKRNTAGLIKAAKQRRQDTIKRVEKTIIKLLKDKMSINFNSVSKVSGVGKPWLYKEQKVREQIEFLRQQRQINTSQAQDKQPQRASDKSKENIILMLKERVKLLDNENKKLKHQIEVLYGELCTTKEAAR